MEILAEPDPEKIIKSLHVSTSESFILESSCRYLQNGIFYSKAIVVSQSLDLSALFTKKLPLPMTLIASGKKKKKKLG